MNAPRVLRVVGLAVGCSILLLPSACSSSPSAKADCAAPVTGTSVTISGSTFQPPCLQAAIGSTITVTNRDSVPHTYTIGGTSVDVEVSGDQTVRVPLTGVAAGTYSVTCRFHPQMGETLKIA